MENRLTLSHVKVKKNRLDYQYELQGDWKERFVPEEKCFAEYSFDLEGLPPSVLVLPFLGRVLPEALRCRAEVVVPCCDADFAQSVERLREGIAKMHPGFSEAGRLLPEKTVETETVPGEGSILLFSEDPDSYAALVRHKGEMPELSLFWGDEIPLRNHPDWDLFYRRTRKSAEEFGVDFHMIRTDTDRVLKKAEKGINPEGVSEAVMQEEEISGEAWDTFCHLFRRLLFAAPAAWYREKSRILLPSLHVRKETEEETYLSLLSEVRFFGTVPAGETGFSAGEDIRYLKDFSGRTHTVLPLDLEFMERKAADPAAEKAAKPEDILTDASGGTDTGRKEESPVFPARCFLFGTPDHGSLGDHQIVESMKEFLASFAPQMQVQEISMGEYKEKKERLKKLIRKNDVLLLPGGGAFGNLWPRGDILRRDVFASWPDNPKLMFPQSVFFTEDEEGRTLLEKSREVYRGEEALLSFRDPVSFETAKKNFSCNMVLVPDIAAWSDRRYLGKHTGREGILFLARSDRESVLDRDTWEEMQEELLAKGCRVSEKDMVVHPHVSKASRRVRLDTMLQEIGSSEAVVTDYLHGMIFCAITQTPCVVLGNRYHDIRSSMSWFENLPYIRFLDDPQQCFRTLESVIHAEKPVYPLEEMRKRFAPLLEMTEKTFLKAGKAETGVKNRKPLVTVLIPVYNTGKFLAECLTSVTGQSYRELEIICVDDGSTDDSPQILRSFQEQDGRIRVITQKNCGVSAARNNGIDHASGKYLYCLDSDDYLETDALEKMVSRMEAEELDLLEIDKEPFGEKEHAQALEHYRYLYARIYEYPDLCTGPELMRLLMDRGEYQTSAWGYMTTLELLKKHNIRFIEGILHEDNTYTFLCYIHAERAGHLAETLYHRRVSEGSITMKPVTFENVRGYFLSFLELEHTIGRIEGLTEKEKEAAGTALQRMLHNARMQYGKLSEEERNRRTALSAEERMLFQALVLDSSLIEKAEKNEELQKRLEEAYSDKSERGKKIREQSAQISGQKARIREQKEQIKAQKDQNRTLEKEKKLLISEKEALAAEKKQLQEEKKLLQEEEKLLQGDIVQQTEQIRKLEEQRDSQKDQIGALKEKTAGQEKQIHLLESQRDDLKKTLKNIRSNFFYRVLRKIRIIRE